MSKRSRTAQGVAAQRALLTERGVLDDPYARPLLGPSMAALYTVVRRRPQVVPTLQVTLAGFGARVLWHDARLRAALDAGVRQVAVIGAGYDSRAWRLRRDGVRFFELDEGTTQQDKVRRAPGPGPTYVEADLRARTAAGALVDGGLDPVQPAVFVLEGLTMYLTEEIVRRQLTALAELGAGSRLTTDFYPPRATTAADRKRLRAQRLGRLGSGETLRFGVARQEAIALVESCGWHVDDAVPAREAAQALVPRSSSLPVEAVSRHGTFLAATRSGSAPAGPTRPEGAAGATGAPPPHEDGRRRVHDGLDARGRQQDVGAVTGAVHAEHAAIVRDDARRGRVAGMPLIAGFLPPPDAGFLPASAGRRLPHLVLGRLELLGRLGLVAGLLHQAVGLLLVLGGGLAERLAVPVLRGLLQRVVAHGTRVYPGC